MSIHLIDDFIDPITIPDLTSFSPSLTVFCRPVMGLWTKTSNRDRHEQTSQTTSHDSRSAAISVRLLAFIKVSGTNTSFAQLSKRSKSLRQ